MAAGYLEFRSLNLSRPVRFRFISPADFPPMFIGDNPNYKRPMKALYLLHGYNAGHNDWPDCSRVAEYALQYNMMVFFPDGDNSFYLDRPGTGNKYASYIGEELVAFTRKLFGLSDKKEDTYIGGYSMGGFGALHNALAYPDTFGKVFCLSSAMIIHNVARLKPGEGDMMADYTYYRDIFGEPSEVVASKNNPETLILDLQAQGKALPAIYMAVGTEDFLVYGVNQELRSFLEEHQVPFTYEEGPGMHDFNFWDPYAKKAIEWLAQA